MSNLKILYIGVLPKSIRDLLYSGLPEGFDLEFFNDKSYEVGKDQSLRNIDFIMGHPRSISSRDLEICNKLKMVQILSAGYEYFDIEQATKLGIIVANNGGANAISVAEHTILLILALYKKLCKYQNALREGVWFRGEDHPANLFELSSKVVGVVGFGNIGKILAKILIGFRVEFNYYDIIRNKEAEKELNVKYLDFEELLRVSDIVSLHLPLTQSTKNTIGKKQLDLMKNTSILINTSRGEIVNEQELYQALKSKKIAGAGLDVFVKEEDIQKGKYRSPLLELENVVATPHYAGHTYDSWTVRIKTGYENIIKAAEGKDPDYIINRNVLTHKRK